MASTLVGGESVVESDVESRFDLATVIGLAVALVGVGIGAGRLSDNSFFTHLATGRHTLDHGFMKVDAFTWTSGGEPVVVQSWLASLVYGLVDSAAGFGGLRMLVAATAGAVAWTAWRLTAGASSVLTRLALMVPVLLVGLTAWTERPLLFGLLLLGITLLVAATPRRPWVLVIVGAVWIGVHGSWPLGLVALLALAAGSLLDGRSPRSDLRAAGYLTGGLLVGAVLNPYGVEMLWFPVDLLGRQDALRRVVEWQAPDFQSLWMQAFLVLVLAALIAGRRASWRSIVPAVVFVGAALMSRRNIPLAVLVLLPMLAEGLPSLGSLDGGRTSSAIRLAGRALLVLLFVLPVMAIKGPHVDVERYPVAAVDALEDMGLSPTETRLMHPDFVGNYLDLRYGDARATWIDDRFELHDQALIDDYITLLDAGPGWRSVLDAYPADVMLWSGDAPVVELATEVADWQVVWSDDDWSVLCRPTAC